MILIFEIDIRKNNKGHLFRFEPMIFKAIWKGKRCWRIGWLIFSLSYYPEKGIKDFFEYIDAKNTCWYENSQGKFTKPEQE